MAIHSPFCPGNFFKFFLVGKIIGSRSSLPNIEPFYDPGNNLVVGSSNNLLPLLGKSEEGNLALLANSATSNDCKICLQQPMCRFFKKCEKCIQICQKEMPSQIDSNGMENQMVSLSSRFNAPGDEVQDIFSKTLYPVTTLKTGEMKEIVCRILGIHDTADIDTVTIWVTTKSNKPPLREDLKNSPPELRSEGTSEQSDKNVTQQPTEPNKHVDVKPRYGEDYDYEMGGSVSPQSSRKQNPDVIEGPPPNLIGSEKEVIVEPRELQKDSDIMEEVGDTEQTTDDSSFIPTLDSRIKDDILQPLVPADEERETELTKMNAALNEVKDMIKNIETNRLVGSPINSNPPPLDNVLPKNVMDNFKEVNQYILNRARDALDTIDANGNQGENAGLLGKTNPEEIPQRDSHSDMTKNVIKDLKKMPQFVLDKLHDALNGLSTSSPATPLTSDSVGNGEELGAANVETSTPDVPLVTKKTSKDFFKNKLQNYLDGLKSEKGTPKNKPSVQSKEATTGINDLQQAKLAQPNGKLNSDNLVETTKKAPVLDLRSSLKDLNDQRNLLKDKLQNIFDDANLKKLKDGKLPEIPQLDSRGSAILEKLGSAKTTLNDEKENGLTKIKAALDGVKNMVKDIERNNPVQLPFDSKSEALDNILPKNVMDNLKKANQYILNRAQDAMGTIDAKGSQDENAGLLGKINEEETPLDNYSDLTKNVIKNLKKMPGFVIDKFQDTLNGISPSLAPATSNSADEAEKLGATNREPSMSETSSVLKPNKDLLKNKLQNYLDDLKVGKQSKYTPVIKAKVVDLPKISSAQPKSDVNSDSVAEIKNKPPKFTLRSNFNDLDQQRQLLKDKLKNFFDDAKLKKSKEFILESKNPAEELDTNGIDSLNKLNKIQYPPNLVKHYEQVQNYLDKLKKFSDNAIPRKSIGSLKKRPDSDDYLEKPTFGGSLLKPPMLKSEEPINQRGTLLEEKLQKYLEDINLATPKTISKDLVTSKLHKYLEPLSATLKSISQSLDNSKPLEETPEVMDLDAPSKTEELAQRAGDNDKDLMEINLQSRDNFAESEDNLQFSNRLGQIARSSSLKDLYFVGNGIKLPLRMKVNDDGSTDFSVDLEKLCSCKNESCSKDPASMVEKVGAILEKDVDLHQSLQRKNSDVSKRSPKIEFSSDPRNMLDIQADEEAKDTDYIHLLTDKLNAKLNGFLNSRLFYTPDKASEDYVMSEQQLLNSKQHTKKEVKIINNVLSWMKDLATTEKNT